MKVLHVSSSNDVGGAARAASRIHMAQITGLLDSRFLVDRTSTGGGGVIRPTSTPLRLLRSLISPLASILAASLQRPTNPVLHSAAFFSSVSAREINRQQVDVVNLHWINGGMLSIHNISRIKRPLVWTLHDTWPFSGAEHYDGGEERWKESYSKKSRPPLDRGIDLNRASFLLKSALWRRGFGIVAPSTWIGDCVKASSLMGSWPVRVIPNPIDSKTWRPVDKKIARDILGLQAGVPTILFGAAGGTRDPRKGFDLFRSSISDIQKRVPGVHFLIFGEENPEEQLPEVSVTYLGVLKDDVTLRLAYSAADVFAITSRQDNLPNTGIEAQSCGTPVVAFDVGGLPDVVEHLGTGYLAKPFDLQDFANGIDWALKQVQEGQIAIRCRTRAESVFSEERVSKLYSDFYEEIVKAQETKLEKHHWRKAQ